MSVVEFAKHGGNGAIIRPIALRRLDLWTVLCDQRVPVYLLLVKVGVGRVHGPREAIKVAHPILGERRKLAHGVKLHQRDQHSRQDHHQRPQDQTPAPTPRRLGLSAHDERLLASPGSEKEQAHRNRHQRRPQHGEVQRHIGQRARHHTGKRAAEQNAQSTQDGPPRSRLWPTGHSIGR